MAGPSEPKVKQEEEALNVGAVAVINYDDDSGKSKSETVPTEKTSKLGAFLIAKADERLLEPGERLVTVVQRHPIGIFAIYAEMLTGIFGIIAISLLLVFSFFRALADGYKGLILAGAVLIIGFLILLLIISTYVYRKCRLVVTDKSVVQVIQKALFNRKISRLSMSNVEDVNVEQNGILATALNYGTLIIQTAGEVDNFVFPMCPNPDMFANQVLEARQQYVRKFGEKPED